MINQLGGLFRDVLLPLGLTYGATRLAQGNQPSAGEMAGQTMDATTKMLPEYFAMLRDEAPKQALAEQALRDQFGPAAAAQQVQLADKYMPMYGQIGRDESYYDRMSDAATGVDVMRGPGGAMVDETFAKARQVDPEFYGRRAQTSSMLGDLLRSFAAPGTVTEQNPFGTFTGALSGGEREEIQRSLNQQRARSGGMGGPRAMTDVVANAMTFGQGVQNRRDALGRALNQATSFLPASRSGFDPLQVAMGRPSTHFGAQQFTQPQMNTQGLQAQGANVFGAASNMARDAAGYSARQPSFLDSLGQVQKMFPGGLSW